MDCMVLMGVGSTPLPRYLLEYIGSRRALGSETMLFACFIGTRTFVERDIYGPWPCRVLSKLVTEGVKVDSNTLVCVYRYEDDGYALMRFSVVGVPWFVHDDVDVDVDLAAPVACSYHVYRGECRRDTIAVDAIYPGPFEDVVTSPSRRMPNMKFSSHR